MGLGLIEQLIHSTVRIETDLRNGGISTGTGFYMNFLQNQAETIPVIVTNKHVVSSAMNGRFHITLASNDGLPDVGNHIKLEIRNFEDFFVKHPDPKIDLTAFLIGPIFNYLNEIGKVPFFVPIQTDLIPKVDERKDLSPMEDIIMIGYPNGIWDEKNNFPVIRKGITATHPNIHLNGNSEFLTDIASFPGSSGSPVFLANIGSYMDGQGRTFMGAGRIRLLGIHYAGAMHTALGEIKIVTAPTTNIPVPITAIPNNIGVAINSNEIFTLEEQVKIALSNPKNLNYDKIQINIF